MGVVRVVGLQVSLHTVSAISVRGVSIKRFGFIRTAIRCFISKIRFTQCFNRSRTHPAQGFAAGVREFL
ncbi:MAG: hypothetical protein CME59_16470 [Halioglobus sp.]|nr:hypothetical protein [Halioglobus sp.]